jgi:hypothetical protein
MGGVSIIGLKKQKKWVGIKNIYKRSPEKKKQKKQNGFNIIGYI